MSSSKDKKVERQINLKRTYLKETSSPWDGHKFMKKAYFRKLVNEWRTLEEMSEVTYRLSDYISDKLRTNKKEVEQKINSCLLKKSKKVKDK